MNRSLAQKFSFIGAGIGLVVFAIMGLLYGSVIGGVIGLRIAHQFFDTSAAGILPKIIVTLGILCSVLLAAVVCIIGTAIVGYLFGAVLDAVTSRANLPATHQRREN